MSLANKAFKNNVTGEVVRVIDSFENIAILENKQKIDVRTLMDPNKYTEDIDPASFFNNQGAYNALAEKIKNIPTSAIRDEDEGPVMSIDASYNSDFGPVSNESAVIMSSEEDEKAELMRKYGAVVDNSDAVMRQQESFSRLLSDETEEPVTQVVVNNQPVVNNTQPVHQPPVQRIEVEDPIITMFKRTKRNVNFNVNVEISDKIPRLDFIEMMEDSYEISMIDFLADEFTNKILSDPTQIRETIKNKIKQLVYGGDTRLGVTNKETLEGDSQEKEDKKSTEKNEPLSFEKEPVLTKDLKKNTRKPRVKKETTK